MDYIYCAVFSDNTAKFGRSTDIWNRMQAYEHEAKRYGNSLRVVFVSTVFDGPRIERDILSYAESRLELLSRESFRANSISEIIDVFSDARVPFIIMKKSADKFGLEVNKDSFTSSVKLTASDAITTPRTRVEKIADMMPSRMKSYKWKFSMAAAINKFPNDSEKTIKAAFDLLVDRGVVEKIKDLRLRDGYEYRLIEA